MGELGTLEERGMLVDMGELETLPSLVQTGQQRGWEPVLFNSFHSAFHSLGTAEEKAVFSLFNPEEAYARKTGLVPSRNLGELHPGAKLKVKETRGLD